MVGVNNLCSDRTSGKLFIGVTPDYDSTGKLHEYSGKYIEQYNSRWSYSLKLFQLTHQWSNHASTINNLWNSAALLSCGGEQVRT